MLRQSRMSASGSPASSSGSAAKEEVPDSDSATISISVALPEGESSHSNISDKTGNPVRQVIWDQMNLTLKDLEYLNSPYSASIVNAMENLMEEFGKIGMELTSIEGKLASRGGVKIGDVQLATKVLDRHNKLMDKVYDTLDAVCVVERISARATVLLETDPSVLEKFFKKEMIRMNGTDARGWDNLKTNICLIPGNMSFPIAARIRNIFKELHKRVTAWVMEVNRRVMAEADRLFDPDHVEIDEL